ncbi:hypothetical protein C8J56DRAFT_1159127 [Mycena floridula]|nr:hypothetical protein C8J56DRAFT_1159127 [Mycena floridula]
MSSHPQEPPIYSQEPPDAGGTSSEELEETFPEPQILIIPTVDVLNFQKGFLGADGERAAIEGELQIKGVDGDSARWTKVTMSLRTAEVAFEREIELGLSEVVLFSASTAPLPASLLFSIPLMPDTPQSLHTPHSALMHTLTATLHPADRTLAPILKTTEVHTRRYTSHAHTLIISPETRTLQEPTQVKVELPRTTFKAGEAIPAYVTIPSPSKELVDRGLRLRNIRAELVRVVNVKRDDGDDVEIAETSEPTVVEGSSTLPEKSSLASSSKAPTSPLFPGSTYRSILSRSGAQCRFHASRPVQMRLVLRQSPLTNSPPSDFHRSLDSSSLDSDADCPAISQLTLLHSVSFRVNILISFVDMSNRTERISSISIPVSILPPPAPLPEIAASMDVAYQKKHDRPPAKTNRQEDADFSAPRYTEGQAGPSFAPPPFEERDAPPPFFSSAAEASSSTRLPTFLESESEIIMPHDSSETAQPTQASPMFAGEGITFGFSVEDQFDGHSQNSRRSSTPPPSLEMASMDTDVTSLAEMLEPERSIEVLGIVLDQQSQPSSSAPPPPPPALDDPSDPPPSIDSDSFRSPDAPRQNSPQPSPPLHPVYNESPGPHPPSPAPLEQPSDAHAPPPYLVPDETHEEQEHVNRPPPYVD